ncbi:hypothetical protein [Brucella anthropi]|uniref:hypothetical protein n=1 Tax=Brucella anthropi TaxID=529 RepID=UPI000E94640D|nr:hypothetical protein [Brucella anthropi]MDG9792566.1 hypothetical protein [Brucella anthropi]MDH0582458.1 hypothetical protein [Brucella anthropi]MDH0818800.1 hypothetical protein [Brucella anthropi]MDH2085797.1 hypothetical protein [Brucella anthropi]HBQ32587.1 hypothetical protein [Brucella anthropi]
MMVSFHVADPDANRIAFFLSMKTTPQVCCPTELRLMSLIGSFVALAARREIIFSLSKEKKTQIGQCLITIFAAKTLSSTSGLKRHHPEKPPQLFRVLFACVEGR